MNTKRTAITLGLASCLAVVPLSFAAQENTPANQNQGQSQSKVGQENLMYGSNLIGQPVKNSQGERIGKIEELMIDPANGKVKYGVLEVGKGFLGMGNKLVAIPWESLHLASSEQGYVLDVDKNTLAQAPSIDQRSWRSRHVASAEGQGSSYRSTSGSSNMGEATENEKQYSGTVEAIDPSAGTITLKKMMISHTFQVGGALNQATLSRFKVGDEVEVGYTEQSGTNVIDRIMPVSGKQENK